MKILILKPSSLGDVVQALPVLRLLRLHFPRAAIHWWIDSALSPLLEGDPDLTEVVLFHRERWVSPRHWPELVSSLRGLRDQRFDWVIDLQALARSAVTAWLVQGRFTIGLDDPREGAPAFYDQAVPRRSFHTHAVDWYLDVLRRLGVPVHPEFEWLPPRPAALRSLVRKWGMPGPNLIALQPGARWPNKRWPIDYFVRLVRRLAAGVPDARFAILGGRADEALGQRLATVVPDRTVDLTGKTTLLELVEWLRRSRLLVTNDTGPMHVATAVRTPVMALFGPTEPRRTGPYRQESAVLQARLPCVPCLRSHCAHVPYLECLDRIAPEQVEARVLEMLVARPPSTAGLSLASASSEPRLPA